MLQQEINEFNGTKLSEFSPISEDHLRQIVMGMSNATCMLDSILTELLKQCIDGILIFLTKIVNVSIQNSHVTQELMLAVVMPLLKKMSLNPEELKTTAQSLVIVYCHCHNVI